VDIGSNWQLRTKSLVTGVRPRPETGVWLAGSLARDRRTPAELGKQPGRLILLKDSPPAQIVEAIRRVADGEPILSPTITRRLMDRAVAESGATARARAAFADLTPREREVVLGIARGETNAEISARLFMSVATVKAHITHILTKLGATNRTQIALLAHDAGLV